MGEKMNHELKPLFDKARYSYPEQVIIRCPVCRAIIMECDICNTNFSGYDTFGNADIIACSKVNHVCGDCYEDRLDDVNVDDAIDDDEAK